MAVSPNPVITLRVRPEQEELGLDLSQHDETLDEAIAGPQ